MKGLRRTWYLACIGVGMGLVMSGAALAQEEAAVETPAATPSAFVPPTAEQIQAAAENPALIKDLIRNANEDQSVEILINVINAVEDMDISMRAKRAKVASLFTETAAVKGDEAKNIIARVVKEVNPRLLPILRLPFGFSLPPIAPRYGGQEG